MLGGLTNNQKVALYARARCRLVEIQYIRRDIPVRQLCRKGGRTMSSKYSSHEEVREDESGH